MGTTVMEWGTISGASMLGMVISLIISLVLPIVLLLLIYKKAKANVLPFFIGCGVFVVFALVLEQIMHTVVFAVTGTFLTGNVILYGLYGGLAAGLFEEAGRFIAMKFFMKKSLNRQNALMYGAGHGGIEAMLLVGLTYVSNLMTSVMINTGILQVSLSTLDESLQVTTFEQVKVLWELPAWQFYMAGVERIMAIALQIALSVLVYKTVKTGCKKYWLIAFFLHFAVDFLTVVIMGYGAPVWVVEVALLVMVILIWLYVYKLYQKDDTVQDEPVQSAENVESESAN